MAQRIPSKARGPGSATEQRSRSRKALLCRRLLAAPHTRRLSWRNYRPAAQWRAWRGCKSQPIAAWMASMPRSCNLGPSFKRPDRNGPFSGHRHGLRRQPRASGQSRRCATRIWGTTPCRGTRRQVPKRSQQPHGHRPPSRSAQGRLRWRASGTAVLARRPWPARQVPPLAYTLPHARSLLARPQRTLQWGRSACPPAALRRAERLTRRLRST